MELEPSQKLPDYLPVRMVNEFVYCPRLFLYEWVEGIFRESADTVEGKMLHERVDRKEGDLPQAEDLPETMRTQSITVSSERLRVVAKMDLVLVEDGVVTPLDYKRGSPMTSGKGLGVWPADRVQIALQALLLREAGYDCREGIVHYRMTNQRVRVPLDEGMVAEAESAVERAWALARAGKIPPPLRDSPKCPGCSLHEVCLPDEYWSMEEAGEEDDEDQLHLFRPRRENRQTKEARRLLTPREERKALYLNTQGMRVGKSGDVIQVREKDALRQEIRLHEICQLNLMGNIQISTQAVQTLCGAGIPICYFSQGGWFYGITQGLVTKNVFLRKAQFRLADEEWFCLRLARTLVAGKIRNQRVMLMRNHIEPPKLAIEQMKEMAERAEEARSLEELLGIEGNGARLYFSAFSGMVKREGEEGEFGFDFERRNRRPPRDPVNALLSLAYSLLSKDMAIACASVGMDPMMGYYHQPRFGRAALALDLMEPFRALIADSAVLSAINTRMVGPKDFTRAGAAVLLTVEGRKAMLVAYEGRMDTLVTHPIFGYRLSYRRLLEVQARLFARVLEGELASYPVFVTR